MAKTYLQWGEAKRYVVLDPDKPADGYGLVFTSAYKADVEDWIDNQTDFDSLIAYKWHNSKWVEIMQYQRIVIPGLPNE